jgi:hypothetical protein
MPIGGVGDGYVDGIALSAICSTPLPKGGEKDRYPALTTGYMSYDLAEKDADGYYTDSHRLLGLDGNADQNLVLTIHYKDGFTRNFKL